MKLISYYYCRYCEKYFKIKYKNGEEINRYIICPYCQSNDLILIVDLFIYEPKLWEKYKKEYPDEA